VPAKLKDCHSERSEESALPATAEMSQLPSENIVRNFVDNETYPSTNRQYRQGGLPKCNICCYMGYTTFELPWEGGLPNDASFDLLLERAKEMCLAVVAGRCEHRFGFLGIRGTIRVDETKTYRVTDYFHLRLNPKVVRYAPYNPAQSE
jgi:hypothetical protein